MVDFDALMLAPVGDDLAKLLVTTAMTYGHLARCGAPTCVIKGTSEARLSSRNHRIEPEGKDVTDSTALAGGVS
ncbi:hypothetical protein A8926_6743 [Saccharopolyspora spinosa]|uniref:Uncharacterized protein n=1 Tax=Saccharopolyspora spinosa TaxID=60894 RepID=A0A2N3Y6W0_SACSN|nr:hypothetical protein A8926_6743 [Saccharopolyspora spinosa]